MAECFDWSSLEKLRGELVRADLVTSLSQDCANSQHSKTLLGKSEVLARIESCIEDVLQAVSQGSAPVLKFDSRNTWDNVRFTGAGLQQVPDVAHTLVKFDSPGSINKFALTLKVLEMIHSLVQTESFCTKRDLYYRDPQAFGSQAVLDHIVDDISCMLQVPRWKLNVLATSKGSMAGDLQYLDTNGTFVDCACTTGGILVPSYVQGITDMRSDARFVLVVEKDATFQKLLDDGFCHKMHPCILITGKGFPDLNTRLMVRKLWDTFHLPTFVFVDADPHGVEIMCIYKFGSRSLSFETSSLAVPCLKWLGLLPSDIERLNIEHGRLPLSPGDVSKIQDLIKRPYFCQQSAWKNELSSLLTSSHKAEIQCLTERGDRYMTDVYLPNKLKYAGWL